MAVTYGYFNSVDGDRTYNADQMSEYFDGLVSDGVYESVGSAMIVKAVSGGGMIVQVGTGRAIVDKKWVKNDAVLNVDIPAAHPTLNKIVSIFVRLTYADRAISIIAREGSAASNPSRPTIVRDATAYELRLANIYVRAGATSISQSDITDMRADRSQCGWVIGIVQQVDTSELFLQYQAAYEGYYQRMTEEFETWFETLESKLNVNTFVQKYRKHNNNLNDDRTIYLDWVGYEYDINDVIMVFVNGIMANDLGEDPDYIIDYDQQEGCYYVQFPDVYPASPVNEADVMVLKSKIGFNTLIGSDQAPIVSENDEEVYI